MNREAYDLYQQLRPALANLEGQRKRVRQQVVTLLSLGGSITVSGVIYILLRRGFTTGAGNWLMGFLSIMAVALSLGYHALTRHVGRAYRQAFKKIVIANIMTLFGEDIVYTPQGGLSLADFNSSGLFRQRPDSFESEDLVSGHIDQLAFRAAEVWVKVKKRNTDADGNRSGHYETLFKGLLFIARYNKPFLGEILILPDSLGARTGDPGQQLQRLGAAVTGRGQLVQMEDPAFERFFAIYSDDQVTARYLLTTSMMARLTAFRKKHKRPIYMSLIDGTIYIAIETGKDLFEPPIHRTLLDLSLYREYIDDIKVITDIIEELDLNNSLWQSKSPTKVASKSY